jgi:hypothetical protein
MRHRARLRFTRSLLTGGGVRQDLASAPRREGSVWTHASTRRATHDRSAASVSTQEIASSSRTAETAERCRRCGALLADDQRYCLECGEPRAPARSALLAGGPASAPAATPPSSPGSPAPQGPGRNNAVVVLAGVGVLLVAMGVGVLIGRAAAPSSSSGAAQVITVGSSPGAGSVGTGAGAAGGEFSDDWPPGKSGYTVLLQSLPQATTSPTAVSAAKGVASAKGAPAVGALKTGDFPSLTAGSYDIYSGEYSTRKQAEAALAKLKKSFPGASVIKVSAAGAAASSRVGRGASSPGGGSSGGSSSSAPGSTSQLQKLSKTKGKNYEQESKNLPNEVGT